MRQLIYHRLRAFAIVCLILAGGLAQSGAPRAYCMSEFRKYFEGLGTSSARINPVERVVFSLLLSEAKPTLAQSPHKQI